MFEEIEAEQSDILAFERGYRGTAFADTVERNYRGTAFANTVERKASQAITKLQELSQDDPNTWTDDALRLMGGGIENVGKVANLPGVKHVLQAADAPWWALRQGVGKLSESAGIDPRLGQWTVGTAEMLTGLGLGKKGARLAGRLTKEATEAAVNYPGRKLNDLLSIGGVAITDTMSPSKVGKASRTVRTRRTGLTISDEFRAIPKDTKITHQMLDDQLVLRQQAEKLLADAGPNPSKGQLDKINSMKSTTTEILPDDPVFYSNQNVAMKRKYTQYEDKLNQLGTLQWHHQNMKAVSSPFLDRAWDIVNDSALKGTQADILNLHQLALNQGVGMGDRMSALLPMGRVPHQKLHNWAKATGIQPTPAQIKEIAEKLKGVDNMEDLTKLFYESLEEMAVPMTREAKIMQNVWEDLSPTKRSELAGLRKQRDEVTRAITKAKKSKKSTGTLEKQLENINNQYDPLKKELVDEFFENRPSYGDYTDEYGNLLQESTWYHPEGQYGKAEQARDRASESLQDLVKDY